MNTEARLEKLDGHIEDHWYEGHVPWSYEDLQTKVAISPGKTTWIYLRHKECGDFVVKFGSQTRKLKSMSQEVFDKWNSETTKRIFSGSIFKGEKSPDFSGEEIMNLCNKNLSTFEVELNMFKQGAIRLVQVPTTELTLGDSLADLDVIWKYGQNDFQPMELPSVSMGDVIRYNGERYLILAKGFKKLKEGDITVGFIP